MRVLLAGLLLIAAPSFAQFQNPPHPATTVPPAQPPIVLPPLPAPAVKVDPKTGKPEPQKLCTRDIFVTCPDERTRNCLRKETVPCD